MKIKLRLVLSCLLVASSGLLFGKENQIVSETEIKENRPYHQTRGGDWFTRLRALYLLPDDHSDAVSSIPGSAVSVHPAWTGEFDFGVMFTRYFGSELILGTANHTIWGEKTLAGTKIGSVWLLPPTLTFQIRPLPDRIIQPYIGGGVNFTVFYGKHCSLPGTSIEFDNSWGPAVQGGVDYFFYQDWLFNLDVKYIWIKTTAYLHGDVKGHVNVTINPWVFGFGFGRKW